MGTINDAMSMPWNGESHSLILRMDSICMCPLELECSHIFIAGREGHQKGLGHHQADSVAGRSVPLHEQHVRIVTKRDETKSPVPTGMEPLEGLRWREPFLAWIEPDLAATLRSQHIRVLVEDQCVSW